MSGALAPAEIAEWSASLANAAPAEIVASVWARYADQAVLTSSFEDGVLIDIVATTAPELEVVLLDTQYHFAETLWYVEELRRRYDLRLTVMRPADDVLPDNLWQSDVEACCAKRKVEPLGRALAGRKAWLTGLRRADGHARAGTPVLSWDSGRRLVKVNPLAAWSDAEMSEYAASRGLLAHPLLARGYLSIGCWPCTAPVAPGQDRRAGRWVGQEKTECGLHR
jgi:phosphoadenosine phosphosulfate reductase